MINNLNLINFKCFQYQGISFKPLTLLSGLNSTGKSSILQALMLLRRSYQKNSLPDPGLILDDDQVYIGTGQDVLFEDAEDKLIGLEIYLENGQKAIWSFSYDHPHSNILSVESEEVDSQIYQSSLFNNKFHYLKAERIEPKMGYPMSIVDVEKNKKLGIKGEYTAHFLACFGNQDIPNDKLSHPKAKSRSLKDQVDAWMGEISPRISISTQQDPATQSVTLKYSFIKGSRVPSKGYSPFNVGFGVTYTLPILVAILAAEPDTLILIENPESHLHPKGQSEIGKLLALAASCQIQIILETHSDHVLNGIRLGVRNGDIQPEMVALHYFQQIKNQGQLMIELISPKVDKKGHLYPRPRDFFDQIHHDSLSLAL